MDCDELSQKLLLLLRSKDYIPQTAAQLAESLGLKKGDAPALRRTLARLLSDGCIARVKGDKFGASSDLDLVPGVIEFRGGGWADLYAEGQPPVTIRPEDTGIALNKDKVLVRILSSAHDRRRGRGERARFSRGKSFASADGKKYGKVIRILERGNSRVTGTLTRSYNFWHVVPDDPHFFYDIIVPAPETSGVFPVPRENSKVVVRLNEWRQRHINPSGEIVENLGESHTPMSEYRAIILKYGLEESFPESVAREVERIPSEVSARDIKNRVDLRGEYTITIDPQDAKDFDDAISLRKHPQGGMEVGVHIADVSYYVRPGSALDREARRRGNSTYLVGTVIPMLPFELSNGICSLVEGRDRLVKSVFLRFATSGDCLGVRFADSVIRSVKRLSYEQANALLKLDSLDEIRKVGNPREYQTGFAGRPLSDCDNAFLLRLRTMVRHLWSVASHLRKRRMKRGSLDLEMPEVKIYCDADGYADRIEKIVHDESHQLVEEFMLAANEAVARELFSRHIPFISRVHDEPDAEKLSELRDELAAYGIPCGDLTSRREVMRVLAEINAHPQGYILKTRFLRSLKRAVYRETPDGHYGLNKVYYAHFTSPIRRFADLTVHRAFDFISENGQSRRAAIASPASLAQTAAHISRTEQNSAEAERDSRKIKLMEFFERKLNSGESFEALITSVSNHGFFVELTESMAYGFVHVHSLMDDIYRLDESGTQLCGRRTGTAFKVGGKVLVEVESVDRYKRQIDFMLSKGDRHNDARAARRNRRANSARALSGANRGPRDKRGRRRGR